MTRVGDRQPLPQRTSCPVCRAVFRGRLSHCPTDGAVLTPLPRDPQIGTLIDRRYAVEAVIGETSLGRIYRADDLEANRHCAVHVMYGEYASLPEHAVLFAEQLARARDLDHPNVVGPLAAGATRTGLPYLVTALIAGRSLAELIRDEAPLGLRRTVALIGDVLAALEAIHGAGLVHGDLTSRHVTAVADPAGAETAIVELARPGNRLGTLPYRAPEQGLCESTDARCDLYAAGVLLYELLSGAAPFTGTAAAQALLSATRPPPPIAQRTSGLTVDPRAEQIALRLLAPDPNRRFASAAAARTALARVAL